MELIYLLKKKPITRFLMSGDGSGGGKYPTGGETSGGGKCNTGPAVGGGGGGGDMGGGSYEL